MTDRPAVSLVLGGGGPFGIAYGCGVVDALVAAGVPLADAPVLGTSAGSWVGAALQQGVEFGRLAELTARTPLPRPGLVPELARAVFGDRPCPGLTAVAVRLPLLRRELLDAGALPVHRVVAASSAVPGLFPPVRLGRGVFVDGGVRSGTSADLAAPADLLLVVAPMAGPVLPPAGSALERLVQREMRQWADRHGGATALIRPDAEIAGGVRNPVGLFRSSNVRQVYAQAREQAERWVRSEHAAALA